MNKPFYQKNIGGPRKTVKNLGWVLRYHRKHMIERLMINENPPTLCVLFTNGVYYECEFADYSVLCQWIKRPSLTYCEIEKL